MNFMTAGDDRYFVLLQENCKQIRTLYKNSPILVYDFGLSAPHRDSLLTSFQPIDVVDWRARLDSIPSA